MNELREKIAAGEHKQWAHWTKYMLSVLAPLLPDSPEELEALIAGQEHLLTHPHITDEMKAELEVTIAGQMAGLTALGRWQLQIATPYAELNELEQDSDREWADKVLLSMVGRVVVMEGSEAHQRLVDAGFSQMDEHWANKCNLVIMEW